MPPNLPAAAYVVDAIALGRTTPMGGALVVLLTNVFFIVTASTATLWVQRPHRACVGR